ncbi:unnamed protein product, partial [Ectocarpus sp. 4 AP-2014]
KWTDTRWTGNRRSSSARATGVWAGKRLCASSQSIDRSWRRQPWRPLHARRAGRKESSISAPSRRSATVLLQRRLLGSRKAWMFRTPKLGNCSPKPMP